MEGNPTMSKSRLAIFRAVITVGLLAAMAFYLYGHWNDLSLVSVLSLQVALFIIAARAVAFLVAVQANTELVRMFAPTIGRIEFLVLSSSSLLLGQLAPPGSTYAAKTVYLRKRHGLRHQEFFAISLVLGFLALAASGITALLALTIMWLRDLHIPVMFSIGAVGMLAPIALFLGLPAVFSNTVGRIKRLEVLVNTGTQLRASNRRILRASFFLLIRSLVSFSGFGILFMTLTDEHGFLLGGVVDALSTILRLVRISPGNLGIYEWMVAGLGHGVGATLSTGLVAAALYRMAGVVGATVVTLLGLGFQSLQQRTRVSSTD